MASVLASHITEPIEGYHYVITHVCVSCVGIFKFGLTLLHTYAFTRYSINPWYTSCVYTHTYIHMYTSTDIQSFVCLGVFHVHIHTRTYCGYLSTECTIQPCTLHVSTRIHAYIRTYVHIYRYSSFVCPGVFHAKYSIKPLYASCVYTHTHTHTHNMSKKVCIIMCVHQIFMHPVHLLSIQSSLRPLCVSTHILDILCVHT